MKKLFAVLVAIVLVASFAFAQEGKGYGPKVQLNLANIGGDNTSNLKTAALMGFGGFMIMGVSEKLDIQFELMYDQKGCDVNGGGSYRLAYVTADALVKYSIPTEGKIKPAVFAGPYVGILASATKNPGSLNVYNDVEGLDYGLIFGAGASMKFGPGNILFDVRYNLGLANMLKTGGAKYKQTNQVIGISVGYAFL
jgi:hypothetical protein